MFVFDAIVCRMSVKLTIEDHCNLDEKTSFFKNNFKRRSLEKVEIFKLSHIYDPSQAI